MVLDIDEFRPEKGGNPDKIRDNQQKRFGDVTMVDKIVESDEKWRKSKFHSCHYCIIFTKLLFQHVLKLTILIKPRILSAKLLETK